ncbi:MAG: hypothetical protein N2C12_03090, partial [Planctomycetales bacterium]
PVIGCMNDEESSSYEEQYQEQYEPESYTPLANLNQRETLVLAGSGGGALLLLAGILGIVVSRRRDF